MPILKATRSELDMAVCTIEDEADLIIKAWGDGDIKRFAQNKRKLIAVLEAAEKQLKDDLYNEATK